MLMTELEHVECAICSRNNEEPLIEAKNIHGSYLISDERFRLVKCKDCGLVYINPRPVREEINKYYDCDYYLSGSDLKARI